MLRDLLTIYTTPNPALASDLALELVARWEDSLAGRVLLHPAFPSDEPDPRAVDLFGWDLGMCRDPWARYSMRLHDAAHVALGYAPTPEGEAELAAYLLANGVFDPAYLGVLPYAVQHGVSPRRMLRAARRGWREPSVIGRVL
jgi:hypothetical protein